MSTKKFLKQLDLWLVFSVFGLIVFACQPPPEVTPTTAPPTSVPPTTIPTPTQEPPPTIRELSKGTVQIFAKVQSEGRLEMLWWGSGTIISSDGLILTNAHVASPHAHGLGQLYGPYTGPEPDVLTVAIVEAEDRPPVETYIAEVVVADGLLDLAVIQIVETLDGAPVDLDSLDLPFVVELGDSDEVHLGQKINIFGFPGIGQETITFTEGTVSGFKSQGRIEGNRAWIKTDTLIAGGNSGGLAANAVGQIIGVPTRGLTDLGALNDLRSINLAKPLIEAAKNNTPYIPTTMDTPGNEELIHVDWAEEIDDNSCPVSPVNNYDSGVLGITSIFSYAHMTNGEDFAVGWFLDGEFIADNLFIWDDGVTGDCYAFTLESGGEPLIDGAYSVVVFAGPDLERVSAAQTTVGEVQECDDCVLFRGQIVEGDTGKGIPGAVILVFKPGTDMDAWRANPVKDPILFEVIADENGFYVFPYLLQRGVEYPVGFVAKGYQGVIVFLTVASDDPDEVNLGEFPLFK